MSEAAIADRACEAIGAIAGCSLLVAPDCSINSDTPEAFLRAAGTVVRSASVA